MNKTLLAWAKRELKTLGLVAKCIFSSHAMVTWVCKRNGRPALVFTLHATQRNLMCNGDFATYYRMYNDPKVYGAANVKKLKSVKGWAERC